MTCRERERERSCQPLAHGNPSANVNIITWLFQCPFFSFIQLIHSYLYNAWVGWIDSLVRFFYHHLRSTWFCTKHRARHWDFEEAGTVSAWSDEDLNLWNPVKIKLFSKVGGGGRKRKSVLPSWFAGQWFGLSLGKNSPWHLGRPGNTGFENRLLVPTWPLPYQVGLKLVISFCILDYKVNTCSVQKVQIMLRSIKQKVFCVPLPLGRPQSPERTS